MEYSGTFLLFSGNSSHVWRALSISESGKFVAVAEFGGYIYLSSDYGKTWVSQSNFDNNKWLSLSMSSDGSDIMAGDLNGNIYLSSDYGNGVWKLVSFESSKFSQIAVSNSGKYVYLSDFNGTIYISSNFGISYSILPISTNITYHDWQSMYIDNEWKNRNPLLLNHPFPQLSYRQFLIR